ncbi:MAG TPA: DUF819 family protein [Woeseiaceae bacterium]|nr:DUF819 family protein [Woeseiaceae bacterium]
MSWIPADDTLSLAALVMAIVAFGLWAERTRWGQRFGGPLLLLALPMALANLGVMPHSAPFYDTVAGYLVPVALPLLLFRADFRAIVTESGPMFVAFLIAAGATVIGACAGTLLVDMGPEEAAIAGTVTASYIGGSLNFVATAEALGIRDSGIYVAALSADAAGAVVFLLLLMLLPTVRFLRNALPSRFIGAEVTPPAGDAGAVAYASPEPFSLPGAVNGLALSIVICAVSQLVCAWLGIDSWFILVVTALALVVANFGRPLVLRVSSDFELGTLFMYLFFVCIGAGANLAEVAGDALPILLFILVMVGVHFVVLLAVGRLLRLDLAEVMIASNACILGPAPAAALAASKGWQALVAPGILVGMFGYAIATFIGVSLARLFALWS